MSFQNDAVFNHTDNGLLAITRNIAWLLKGTGVAVSKKDFVWLDGQWTLDGMDPYEWAEAMTQE